MHQDTFNLSVGLIFIGVLITCGIAIHNDQVDRVLQEPSARVYKMPTINDGGESGRLGVTDTKYSCQSLDEKMLPEWVAASSTDQALALCKVNAKKEQIQYKEWCALQEPSKMTFDQYKDCQN